MPLCPQITLTPITVTSSNMTVTSVIAGGVSPTYEQLVEVDTDAQQALADAAAAQATATQAQADATAALADAAAAQADAATALANASTAYSTAVAANTAASTAQATADGKNKVTYSTSTPGSTANTVGDIWYQYGTTGANAGRIIAQYTGNGGTSWTQTTISGLVVANLDAGSITAGTLSVGIGITGPTNSFTVDAVTGVLTATGVNVTGTITATTGTFTGTVIATTGTFTGTVIANTGTFTGTVIATTGSFTGTITTPSATITGGSLVLGTGNVTTNIGSAGTVNIVDSASGLLSSAGVSLTSTGSSTRAYISTAGFYFGGTTNQILAMDGLNELGSYVAIPRIYAPANKYIRIVPNAGLNSNTYPVYIEGPIDILGRIQCYGNVNIPNIPSTTSAANVRWTTGGTGQLQYVTSSSQRFKDNITGIDNVPSLDPKALLNLPVRAFTYKPDHIDAGDDRFDVMVPGFIAEEVDAVYPVATDYDENGPVSWNDRFIVPALLSLIQDLYKEINALKGGN